MRIIIENRTNIKDIEAAYLTAKLLDDGMKPGDIVKFDRDDGTWFFCRAIRNKKSIKFLFFGEKSAKK